MNMENNTVSKYTISFGLSLALSVVNALLVIAKEKSTAVRAEMQRITGSHWITHVAIVLIFFSSLSGGCSPAPKAVRESRFRSTA